MKTNQFNTRVSAIAIILVMFLATPQFLKAQANYKLSPSSEVVMKVLGSSNIHDWVETASAIESKGDFKFNGNNELTGVTSLNLSVDAKSLKSGHNSMDNRTYKTINADKFPRIIYKLNSAVIIIVQKNKYLIKSIGELTIAGVTQTINMDITAVIGADNCIICTGFEKLKLTDYNINPPSFILGVMKVTNDLTIQFNLVYKNNRVPVTHIAKIS
jgi:polyisoprenoid-binding protein YceI